MVAPVFPQKVLFGKTFRRVSWTPCFTLPVDGGLDWRLEIMNSHLLPLVQVHPNPNQQPKPTNHRVSSDTVVDALFPFCIFQGKACRSPDSPSIPCKRRTFFSPFRSRPRRSAPSWPGQGCETRPRFALAERFA